MPPKMVDGTIQGDITVSERTLILEGDTIKEFEPRCEEAADRLIMLW